MAESNYFCSVEQGFNFQKDEQPVVGHVVACKVGDTQFDADLNVSDPEDAASLIKVFGILSNISWGGGYANPVELSCQVSNANQVAISTLTHKSLSNTEVLLTFNVYGYDPSEKTYYKCFHTNETDLKGLILKTGGDLHLSIADESSPEVESPLNYNLNLAIMPQDQNMEVHVAFSVSGKMVKKWGVEVAA